MPAPRQPLRQFLATLRALADLWTVDPPLDLGDYIAQAEKQLAEYSTPEEEEIRQVAKTNAALEHKLERNVVVGMKAVNTMCAMWRVAPAGLRPEALHRGLGAQQRNAGEELLLP